MIHPPIAAITYKDGSTFELPPIHQSSNGWTYKPDAMRSESEIRRGKNKVWPRTEGSYEAGQWYWQQINAHFDNNKEVPLHIDGTVNSPDRVRGDSLSVTWFTKVWGWISLGLTIDQSRNLLTYSVCMADVAKILLVGTTERHTGYQHKAYLNFEVGATHIDQRVKAFMQNPWESIKQHNESWEWDRILGVPPEDVYDQKYQKDSGTYDTHDRHNSTPVGEVRSTSSGNGLFYRKGVVEAIYESTHNWEAINELLDALKFTGYDIKPQFSYDYSNPGDRKLSGLTITIPPQDGMESHTVHISANNPQVTVRCGFQLDEDKWIDRKKRQADEQLAEMTRDLAAIKYEIEL